MKKNETSWKNARVLILGANSDIAVALARRFAREGANLHLASRNMDELEKEAGNLRVRYGVEANAIRFDAREFDTHPQFYSSLDPAPDGVVIAFGALGDQDQSQNDFKQARAVMETNYLGAVSILEIIAADFEKRGSGFIAGISSVAGDRGRATNYIYGSSKAGFTNYLSGLRQRLQNMNIPVLTVKPGFVATKMTAGLQLPKGLTAKPEAVAEAIFKAISRRRNTIYVKPVWQWIMAVITHLPEYVFKRIKF